MFIDNLQLPDKVLERRPRETVRDGESSSPQSQLSDSENHIIHDEIYKGRNGRPVPRPRRLSMYEDGNAVMDPEGETRASSTTPRDR